MIVERMAATLGLEDTVPSVSFKPRRGAVRCATDGQDQYLSLQPEGTSYDESAERVTTLVRDLCLIRKPV